MNSKHPYLDPDWIPILREWISPVMYDQSQTSDALARQLAYLAGRMDIVSKLETIVKLQEKKHGHS
jgi:hypothetical protein